MDWKSIGIILGLVVGFIILIVIFAAIYQSLESTTFVEAVDIITLNATSCGSSPTQPETTSGKWFVIFTSVITITYYLSLIFLGFSMFGCHRCC